ncbi:VOC family protein [Janibacter alittae]|uniref:VOC family protein n=1 Tax=Janibacter alittae TaxID=3115209 RepID=A0ABZ2MHI5_9MICO
MRITGLVIATPDVAATRAAWRRLGGVDRDVHIEEGEGGLTAVLLGVDEVATTERLWRRRGLVGDAAGFDLGGTTWRPTPSTEGESGELALDHLVVRTGDGERAAADYGARLGLDLRLDRQTDHGFRGLFFRCGNAVVEVIVPGEPHEGPDTFGGVAWRVADLDATRARLAAKRVELSPVREGRKPGTRVTTVRDPHLAVPTLLVASA